MSHPARVLSNRSGPEHGPVVEDTIESRYFFEHQVEGVWRQASQMVTLQGIPALLSWVEHYRKFAQTRPTRFSKQVVRIEHSVVAEEQIKGVSNGATESE